MITPAGTSPPLMCCTFVSRFTAVQHERGPRTSTIRKQVALYFRGHKEVNGSSTHFSGSSMSGPPFFTTVTQLEPHNLEMSNVATTPERQAIVGLAQPTPKVGDILRWLNSYLIRLIFSPLFLISLDLYILLYFEELVCCESLINRNQQSICFLQGFSVIFKT